MDDVTLQGGGRPPSGVGPPPTSQSSSGETALPEVGEVVANRYRVGTILGRGGMGAVYRASDSQLGCDVALKVMLPGEEAGNEVARFRREAEAVAKVDAHAGIVRVRDLGEHRRMPFVAMDLVEGQDLKALVKAGGPLPVDEALAYTEQTARAIQHCHDKGVLHRDLKPANLLLRAADNQVFVTDFGLALDLTEDRLTKTGEVMGTPAYMSPEQAEGLKDEIDHRTDVYALGAILYELVTGKTPFSGDAIQILKKIFLNMPKAVGALRPDAPSDVNLVCMKAMAKEKGVRYRSAKAFADDVARLRSGEPVSARPLTLRERRGRWFRAHRAKFVVGLGVLLCAVVGAVGGYLFWVKRKTLRETLVEDLREFIRTSPPLPEDADDTNKLGTQAISVIKLLASHDREEATFDSQKHSNAERAEHLAQIYRDVRDERDRPLVKTLAWLKSEDDPLAFVPLETLARRLGFSAGLGDVLADESTQARSEDLLFEGLHLLSWGRDSADQDMSSPVDVDGARTLLDRVAKSDTLELSAAASQVLANIAKVDSACAEYVAFGVSAARDAGPKLRVRDWPELKTLYAKTKPQLRAYLIDRLRTTKDLAAAESVQAIDKAISSLDAKTPLWKQWDFVRAWREGPLKKFLAEEPSLALADAPKSRVALRSLVTNVAALATEERARGSRLQGFVGFVGLFKDDFKWTPEVQESCANVLFFGLIGYMERGEVPPGDALILGPRFETLLPPFLAGACRVWVKGGLFKRTAEATKKGDGYLTWARALDLLGETRDENQDAADRCALLVRCFANAIGPALRDETWLSLGLGKGTRVELSEPMNRKFEVYALSQVGQYAIRGAEKRFPGTEPDPTVLVAAAELLAGLSGRLDEFHRPSLLLDHCKNGAHAIGSVCKTALDPNSKQAKRLLKVEGELYDVGVATAWGRIKAIKTGKATQGLKQGSLHGVGSKLDLTKQLRDLMGLLENQGKWRDRTGHKDGAFEGYANLERWYLARKRAVDPQVLVDWCHLAQSLQEYDELARVSTRLLDRLQATPPRGPRDRKQWFAWRDKGRGQRASVLLHRGDHEAAKALYEEAKKAPGHRPTDTLWAPFQGR